MRQPVLPFVLPLQGQRGRFVLVFVAVSNSSIFPSLLLLMLFFLAFPCVRSSLCSPEYSFISSSCYHGRVGKLRDSEEYTVGTGERES